MKLFCAIILASFMAVPCLAGDAGTTGANFLKLGVGPRAIGMGEAQVGLADDAFATYWNPAGLSQLQVPEAGFVHTEHVEGIQEQYATYAHPLSKGVLAGAFTHLGIEKFQGYDAGGQPTAEIGASDTAFALSYARTVREDRRLGSALAFGMTGKWIRETLQDVSANAIAADLGLHWTPGRRWKGRLAGWRAGMVARNLGSSIKFDEESFALPRSLSAGIAYTGVWLGESLTVALDATQPSDGDAYFSTGLELWTLRTLVLRTGYTTYGDLGNGLRAGAGIRLKNFEINYAWTGLSDFGNAHRIGLTYRFGKPPASKESLGQDWYEKGVKNFEKKRYTEALVDFNKALEIDPAHPTAYDMMKKTYDAIKENTPQ
jgi:hypothetical protein